MWRFREMLRFGMNECEGCRDSVFTLYGWVAGAEMHARTCDASSQHQLCFDRAMTFETDSSAGHWTLR